MKSKNEKSAASHKNSGQEQQQKNSYKKQTPVNIDRRSATDTTKSKSGRGMANEGTITSYDEER